MTGNTCRDVVPADFLVVINLWVGSLLLFVRREEYSSSSSSSREEDPTPPVGSKPSFSSNSSLRDSVAERSPSATTGTIVCSGVSSASRINGLSPSLLHPCRPSSFQGNYEGEVVVDRRPRGEEEVIILGPSAELGTPQGTRSPSICGTNIIGDVLRSGTDDPPPKQRYLAETAIPANQTEVQQGDGRKNYQAHFTVASPAAGALEVAVNADTTSANNILRSTASAVPAIASPHLTYNSSQSSPQSPPPQHPRARRCMSKEADEVKMAQDSQGVATSTDFAALELNLERWGIPPAFPPCLPPTNQSTPATYPTHRCQKYQPEDLSHQHHPSGLGQPSGFDGACRGVCAKETGYGGVSHSLESPSSVSAQLLEAVSQRPSVGTKDDDDVSFRVVVAAEKARLSRAVLFDRNWLDGIKLQHLKNKDIDSHGRGTRHAGRCTEERHLERWASDNVCGSSAPPVGTPVAKHYQKSCRWGLEGAAAAVGPSHRGFNLGEEDINGDCGEGQKKKLREGVDIVVPAYPRWHEKQKALSLANAWKRMAEDVLRQTVDNGGERTSATSFKRPWLPSQLDYFQAWRYGQGVWGVHDEQMNRKGCVYRVVRVRTMNHQPTLYLSFRRHWELIALHRPYYTQGCRAINTKTQSSATVAPTILLQCSCIAFISTASSPCSGGPLQSRSEPS